MSRNAGSPAQDVLHVPPPQKRKPRDPPRSRSLIDRDGGDERAGTPIPDPKESNEHHHDPDHHHPRPAGDLPVPARVLGRRTLRGSPLRRLSGEEVVLVLGWRTPVHGLPQTGVVSTHSTGCRLQGDDEVRGRLFLPQLICGFLEPAPSIFHMRHRPLDLAKVLFLARLNRSHRATYCRQAVGRWPYLLSQFRTSP